MRYNIEYYSGKSTPTIGAGRLLHGGNPIVVRDHAPKRHGKSLDNHGAVILLLRNYKESYVRYAQRWNKDLRDYTDNIQLFEQFPGRKMVLYYEDMIQNYDEIGKVLDFLEIEHTLLVKVEEIEKLKKHSITLYTRAKDSLTNGDADKLLFHSEQLDDTTKIDLDNQMKKTLGPLYDKYIKRYEEK